MVSSDPSTATVLAFLFLAYVLYKLIPRYAKYKQMQSIPGPDCGFWVGMFPTVFREPFMEPHQKWWRDIVGYDAPVMRYSRFLGDGMVLLLDPELIREVLTAPVSKDDCRFYKPYTNGPLSSIIGNGLVTLEGKEWMHHRRLIQPAFSVALLKEAVGECVPEKATRFVRHWIDAGEGQEIDAAIHLSALTLDVIGYAGFSYDCNGLKDIEKWAETAKQQSKDEASEVQAPKLTDPLITSMNALMTPDLLRILLFLSGFGKLDQYVNPKARRVIAAFNRTIDKIISHAKQEQEEESDAQKQSTTNGTSKPKPKSLLQLLLNAHDPEAEDAKSKNKPAFTDLELRGEVKTFLFAGHETTSAWCTWALFAMSKFPDVQEKVYQDVMKHAPPGDEPISLEQAEKMEYLAAFLQELLRLYSPVGMTLRRNRYDETLAGYHIPKNTAFVIPIYLMHRHPKHWEEPETFKPERWLKSTTTGMDTRGFTFLPFGAGGHNCIGYRFATFEAKLIVAHLVRALRVEIAPSQRDVEHKFTTTVTMKTKPALKIVVKPRGVASKERGGEEEKKE